MRAKKAALERTLPTETTGSEHSELVMYDDSSEQSKESDMESSLSSHTSLSNNFDVAVVDKDNDLARRLVEMSRMSDEDKDAKNSCFVVRDGSKQKRTWKGRLILQKDVRSKISKSEKSLSLR
jgi:hypothetical protein